MIQRQTVLGAGLALAWAIVGGSVAVIDVAGQAPKGGFFTDAQAASGEAVYRQSCASCHGAALRGGTAPPLVGPAFEASWGNPRVTLGDLFFIMRTTMPPRSSRAVPPQDHAAM